MFELLLGIRKATPIDPNKLNGIYSLQSVSGTPPTGRSLHAAAANAEKVFVSGGMTSTAELHDVFVYDIATKAWSQPAGFAGTAGINSNIQVVGNKLYQFKTLNLAAPAFRVLDLTTMTWSTLTLPNSGSGTISRSATYVVGTKMYIWDGMRDSAQSNTLRVFDTVANTLTVVSTHAAHGWDAVLYVPDNDPNTLYILNSYKSSGVIKEFWKLDIAGNSWTKTATITETYFQPTFLFHKNLAYVSTGGVLYQLNLNTGVKTKVVNDPRSNVIISQHVSNGNQLFATCGEQGSARLSSIWTVT